MTSANILFQNPPPLYNVQGRAVNYTTHDDIGAPPSYEEAINPNGICI